MGRASRGNWIKRAKRYKRVSLDKKLDVDKLYGHKAKWRKSN